METNKTDQSKIQNTFMLKNVELFNTLSSNVSKENVQEIFTNKGDIIIQNAFDNYAGFDGNGGYHGKGGHGGNQINLFPNKPKQNLKQQFQIQLPNKDKLDKQSPFLNQNNQLHTNREQRAVSFMMPIKFTTATFQSEGQNSFQSSPKVNRLDFLHQNNIDLNNKPSMIDILNQNNSSFTKSDQVSMSPFTQKINSHQKNKILHFENSIQSLQSAGYDGPQKLSQEQLFKIRNVQAELAQKLKLQNQSNDYIYQSKNDKNQLLKNQKNQSVTIQNNQNKSIFPIIDDQNKNQERTVFNIQDLQEKYLSDKANYLLTGEKKLKIKAQNLNNISLLPKDEEFVYKIKQEQNFQSIQPVSVVDLNKEQYIDSIHLSKKSILNSNIQEVQDIDIDQIKYPPLFKQQPIWKNIQQKSQFSKQIENNGQIFNKHFQNFNSFQSIQFESEPRAITNIFKKKFQDQIDQKRQKNETDIFSNKRKNEKSQQEIKLELLKAINTVDTLRVQLDSQTLDNNDSKMQILDEQSIQEDKYIKFNIEKVEENLQKKKMELQALKLKMKGNVNEQKDQQKLIDLVNQINLQEKQIFLIQSQYQGSELKLDKQIRNLESSRNQSNDQNYMRSNESQKKLSIDAEESIFSSLQKKYTSALKKSVLPQSQRINSQNARTNQSSQHIQSSVDVKQEFSALHIYDSILLSKKVDEMVQQEKNLKKQIRLNKSLSIYQKDSSTALNHQMNIKLKNDFKQNKKQNENSPKRDHPDIDDITVQSSSAQSNFQTIQVQDQTIETLKGTKFTQLSPLTRQLNKIAQSTLQQIELFQLNKLKAERNKIIKMEGSDQEISKESKLKLDENQKAIKILKYQLINLVAPESEKYQLIMPNNEYYQIEILPQMIPVFLKVPCQQLKSPCYFEVLMNDVEAMQVLMSTSHKFPSEEDQNYEYDKLIIQDKAKEIIEQKQNNNLGKEEEKRKNQVKKTSILLMEVYSKLRSNQQNKADDRKYNQEISQKKKKQEELANLMLTKQQFRFVKQNFQENFDDGDQIYIALISFNGGSIKLRATCTNQTQAAQPNDNKKEEAEQSNQVDKQKQQVPQISQEDLLNELQEWFNQNIHMLGFYQNNLNFVQLNKSERLQNFFFNNQSALHQNKILYNQQKRETALDKAQAITFEKYEKNKINLQKWENYRETKIEMTAIYIKILKRKNFTRRWLNIQKMIQIFSKIIQNLFIRRNLNHILFTSIHTAIRFKMSYLYRYRKQYGFDMTQRTRNEIRRSLNFGGIAKYNTIIQDVKKRLAGFIFKAFLVFNTCEQFTYFNNSLLYIQEKRMHLQMTREYRWKVLYKRLNILKDCLIQFYAKKKSKKHGQKLIKALKKNFGQGRQEDYKMVKNIAQQLWGKKNMLECKNLLDSIKVRGLTIQHLILAKCNIKDEEGNKFYKNEIEDLKTQIEAILKIIRKNTKEIEKVERDMWSWPDKEIKDLQKKAKFRKPDPKDVELAEIHKYDTAKIIKDDKLLKFCKTQYMKKIKPKKLGGASPKKDKKVQNRKGSIDMEGDEEGMDGEGMEGADMEGAEGEDMEGEDPEGNADKAEDANEAEVPEDQEEGAKEKEEPAEGEMEEAMGSEAEGDKDDQAKDQKDNEEGPDKGSPKKGSQSPGKKTQKKKQYEDTITLILQKPNPKQKGKFLVDEKIQIPQEIQEHIEQQYPVIQNQEEQDVGAYDQINVIQVQQIVDQMFMKQEKKKLIRMTESQNMRPDFTAMIRIILHLGLNVGPQQQLNEDIAENMLQSDITMQQTKYDMQMSSGVPKEGEHEEVKQKKKKGDKNSKKLKSMQQEASEENKTPISPKENEQQCSREARRTTAKINLSNQNNSQDDHHTVFNEQIPTNQSVGQLQDNQINDNFIE